MATNDLPMAHNDSQVSNFQTGLQIYGSSKSVKNATNNQFRRFISMEKQPP
jgi:hypothetical protein